MSKCAMSKTSAMDTDETIVKVRVKVKLVGFVADAESGEMLGAYMLMERDSDGFADWLVSGSRGNR